MGESMLSNQEETEQIAVDVVHEALKDEAEPEAEPEKEEEEE